MATNNTTMEQTELLQTFAEQLNFSHTVGITDLYDIKKILIRNNMTLTCTRIPVLDGLNMIINELQLFLSSNQNISNEEIEELILKIEIDQANVSDLSKADRVIFFGKYMPYLTRGCEMIFHQCRTEEHPDHGDILVPSDQNYDISKAIYYVCHASSGTIAAVFMTDIAYITLVHNKLLLQPDNNVYHKILLYNILISEYTRQANNLQFHQHLLLLSKWQDIYKCYKARMKLNPHLSSIESTSYCRCLIMLRKYSEAEDRLLTLISTLDQPDDVWYLLARLRRKRKKYSNEEIERRKHGEYSAANQSITIALGKNRANNEALKEQRIINKLIERKSLEKISTKYTISHKKRTAGCLSYNILSIDGGGIRGIMAAIWLRELERRTSRTCSSMFQMMAGTSTGAIIAAGLSKPNENDRTTPNFTANYLVNLYQKRGKYIFVGKDRHWCDFRNFSLSLAPIYSSDNKKTEFQRYFKQTSLNECLTDIVIPAVKTGDTYTHLFTKYDSLNSTRLVDVLMATSAAPTYFDPYFVHDTFYIDGGVQMNNPTMAAYTKAIEYGYDKENIYVLSLGTGDYPLDPIDSNSERDIMFYHTNKEHVLSVLFNSQQHNADYQMSTLMDDEHYYRWQVWFEENIELDKYEDNTVKKLEDIAYEYWEEMEADDTNRLNTLVARLRDE
jgi:predicted patatin/cPLA2 family phospholipase